MDVLGGVEALKNGGGLNKAVCSVNSHKVLFRRSYFKVYHYRKYPLATQNTYLWTLKTILPILCYCFVVIMT